jgi:CO/xanthine dehydrogenase Mo-binding subunit
MIPGRRPEDVDHLTGAAGSNAIFHATGKGTQDLPITPDKLV